MRLLHTLLALPLSITLLAQKTNASIELGEMESAKKMDKLKKKLGDEDFKWVMYNTDNEKFKSIFFASQEHDIWEIFRTYDFDLNIDQAATSLGIETNGMPRPTTAKWYGYDETCKHGFCDNTTPVRLPKMRSMDLDKTENTSELQYTIMKTFLTKVNDDELKAKVTTDGAFSTMPLTTTKISKAIKKMMFQLEATLTEKDPAATLNAETRLAISTKLQKIIGSHFSANIYWVDYTTRSFVDLDKSFELVEVGGHKNYLVGVGGYILDLKTFTNELASATEISQSISQSIDAKDTKLVQAFNSVEAHLFADWSSQITTEITASFAIMNKDPFFYPTCWLIKTI